jgi:hypothetical protein
MATLNSYITEVQRLLHDANANFYSTAQLTDYINSARERVVRDTGCLRTIQVTQVPCAIPATNAINGVTPTNPTAWAANTVVVANAFVFSNIYIYQYITGGTSSSTPPPYPASGYNYPPSTAFADGTATLQYVGNTENIYYAALPQGANTIDIVNINLYFGNSRIPMNYMAWSSFNSTMRIWQNNVSRPVVYSIYGQGNIYIGPAPDYIYTVELDTVILPTALVQTAPTAVDPIADPYTSAVKFYAAYLAKFYEQSYGESEIFKQEYLKQANSILNTTFTRRIPSVYNSP